MTKDDVIKMLGGVLAQPAQELTLQKKNRKRGSIALARSLCYEINGAADDSDDMDGGGYGSVDIAEILSAEVVRLQKALAQTMQNHVADNLTMVAQPAQEPVATIAVRERAPVGKVAYVLEVNLPVGIHKLYSTHPQRPWVDLTEDQIKTIEEMALTKKWEIRMAIAQLKECNAASTG